MNEPRLTIPVMIHGTTSGLDTGSNADLRDSIATWRSDMYVTFFEHGVSNVDYLELHNGQFLQESNNDPNFAYFGIQAVHLLADAGDTLVATTTSEDDVRIHAAQRGDGSVAVMVLNMNTSSRTVNVSIDGSMLAEDGVRYQTNGDSPLALTNLSDLGNSFSTSISGRTLQLFVIPALAGLTGDYNGNGIIDAADYTEWRDAVAGGGTFLANDPTPGVIDMTDFDYWRNHFGESLGAGTGFGAGALVAPAVPEPASLWLALVAVAMLAFRRSGLSRRATG